MLKIALHSPRATRLLCLAAALAIAQTCLTRIASAATVNWTGLSGNWSTAANWTTPPSTHNVPAAGDTVNIVNADGVSRTITYDYTGTDITLNVLTVDLTGGGNSGNTSLLSMAGNKLTATTEIVANSGNGSFNLNGGSNTVSFFTVGSNAGSSGLYALSGNGTLSVSNAEVVGYGGTGTFNQSGGTNTLVGNLFVAGVGSANPTGAYALSGGALAVNGYEIIAQSGTATFTQSGGTNTITGATGMFLSFNAGSTSTYTLSGTGVLSVTNQEVVGYGGTGTFTQNGGSNTLVGTLYISGVGSANPMGTYTLTAGALAVNGYEIIGQAGNGFFNQSGGTNTITGPTGLFMSYNPGSTSIYTLSGTGALSVSNQEVVGFGGNATFTQDGGTNTLNGTLYIAGVGSANPVGTYALTAGALAVNGVEIIGQAGNGIFNQSGGTHTITGGTGSGMFLSYNPGSTSTYTLSGTGALSVSNQEVVAFGGTSTFTQNGGTNTLAGTLYLAGVGSANPTGTYTLTAGALAVNGFESIGQGGMGTLNQSGGTNTLTGGDMDLGTFAGAKGTYNLTAGSAFVGGNVFVGGFGGGPGGIGILTINSPGAITIAGTLVVFDAPGNVVNLAGGTINTAGLSFGVPSLLNWTGGTLNLTSSVAFDSAAPTGSTASAFGSSLTLGANCALTVSGNETLGGIGPFTLSVNSGSSHQAAGSITINANGTLIDSGLVIAGAIANAGTLHVDGVAESIITLNGGTLSGHGSIFGAILAGSGAHVIAPSAGLPGTTTGTLAAAAFITNANTTLAFNLVTPGTSSVNDAVVVYNVNGLTISGGALTFPNHSTGPASLGYYKILQYTGTIQGTGPSSLILPAVQDNIAYSLDTTRDPGFLDLHRGFLGDANDDGAVNFADFALLASDFNSSNVGWGGGDFNNDGVVNFADFAILSNHFGGTVGASDVVAGGGAASGVPEPASLALLGAGLLGLARRRPKSEKLIFACA